MTKTHSFIVASCFLLSASSQPLPIGVDSNGSEDPIFTSPERLQAGGEYVKTEAPGWAAPAWFDVNGDGLKDLVVGQFARGKMRVYANNGRGGLSAGTWLEADGEVAEVPDVW